MKSLIITAALASFASHVSAALVDRGLGCELKDLHLSPDGTLSGLLSEKPGTSAASAGSLHKVEVLQGSQKQVQEQLDALLEADPYARPLKLGVIDIQPKVKAPKPAAATTGEDKDNPPKADEWKSEEAPKPKRVFVLVVGYVQP